MMEGVKSSTESDFSFEETIIKRLEADKGIRALASCAAGEVSYEDEAWKNGAMMEALMILLADKARCKKIDVNKDGFLTLSEIFPEIQEIVGKIVRKVRNKKQTPYLYIPDSEEKDVDLFAY